MTKPDVLILADRQDAPFLDTQRRSEHWNVHWKIIDYQRWWESIGEIRELMTRHNIGFVMYSRNDQVVNRIGIGLITKTLSTGYSSFSGIDDESRIDQMKVCYDDFMACDCLLDYTGGPVIPASGGNTGGTYSLIFDTEQLGGVRYGLPRILELLNKYGIRATFFITNLVKKVYPDVLKIIVSQGHEVGLHGLRHEYLSGLRREEQQHLLKNMMEDFNIEINGANFVGRMDETTVRAMIDNRLNYFLYPSRASFRFLSYRPVSGIPSLIRLPEGTIRALPISLETYSAPWFSIRNMIDSAISESRKCEFPHISILCHCFRDGNLKHTGVTEKLLKYLTEKRMQPVVLGKLLNKLEDGEDISIETNELKRFISGDRGRTRLPRAWRDLSGMVIENPLMVYRFFRGNRGTF